MLYRRGGREFFFWMYLWYRPTLWFLHVLYSHSPASFLTQCRTHRIYMLRSVDFSCCNFFLTTLVQIVIQSLDCIACFRCQPCRLTWSVAPTPQQNCTLFMGLLPMNKCWALCFSGVRFAVRESWDYERKIQAICVGVVRLQKNFFAMDEGGHTSVVLHVDLDCFYAAVWFLPI